MAVIQHFAVHLMGQNFVLQTYYKALKQLCTMDHSNQQLMRWLLSLQPYQYVVEHRPGNKHTNADGLSWQRFPEALAKEVGEGGGGKCEGQPPRRTRD